MPCVRPQIQPRYFQEGTEFRDKIGIRCLSRGLNLSFHQLSSKLTQLFCRENTTNIIIIYCTFIYIFYKDVLGIHTRIVFR